MNIRRGKHRFTGLPGQLQPDDDVGLFIAPLSWLFIAGLFCRSELARENLESAAYSLITRVIVGDFREQARAYKVWVRPGP